MNPKLDFWAAILALFKKGLLPDLIDKIESLYEDNWCILSIPHYFDLEEWVEIFRDKDKFFGPYDPVKHMVSYVFRDLAPQMREESVRCLLEEWKELAGIDEEDFLHVQVRRVLSLGEKAGVVTLVVDDLEKFEKRTAHFSYHPYSL